MATELTAPIGAIQKFSTEDGPGIRTTVFIKGCPLNCEWCHNPELISSEVEIIQNLNSCIGCMECIKVCPEEAISRGTECVIINREKCTKCMKCVESCNARALQSVAKEMTVEQVMHDVAQDKGFYNHTGGGMTISGGELLMHYEFVLALVKDAAKKDIQVCLDTSGYGDGEELMELASAENVTDILFDIKIADEKKHEKYTGKSCALIIRNLEKLAGNPEIKKKITLRMPLIAGINDDEKCINAAAKLYKHLGLSRVTLLPYHNLGVSKKKRIGGYQECFETPSDNHVEEIKTCFEAVGMIVDIQGKV